MDCVFCKIIAGEIPGMKVYEDEHTIVIMDIAGDIFIVAGFPVDPQGACVMEIENASVKGAGSLVLRIVITERCPAIGIAFQIQICRVAGAVLVDGQLREGAEIAVFVGVLRLLKEIPCACGGVDGLVSAFRELTGSVVLLESPVFVAADPREYQGIVGLLHTVGAACGEILVCIEVIQAVG